MHYVTNALVLAIVFLLSLATWGAKEFALAVPSGVCVVIQQWGK
jgi:hypothetical protein